ncbi:MAG: phytanoyl-CoA dioxygenase family protein [SAR324 cluster bacterium]|nr:phytanoyl-CoA dioxygenase family protein [SAR324 cluster bacterium]
MQKKGASCLSPSQIESYQGDGALVLRGFFKHDIELLRAGFEKVLQEPSQHGRENVSDGEPGRFFEDYCNWERIPEFRHWIEKSSAAQIAGEATDSEFIQIFHEHILVKEPGTSKETTFHQDLPYYCVDGHKTASFWIPLDPVFEANTLRIVLGSHRWPKLIRPTRWLTNEPWYKTEDDFMEMPVINESDFEILAPQLDLGDAVLFNFKTVHGAPGNETPHRRRAFSARFLGDDVRYVKRGGATSPPFDGIGLSHNEKMRKDWFPVLWSRGQTL